LRGRRGGRCARAARRVRRGAGRVHSPRPGLARGRVEHGRIQGLAKGTKHMASVNKVILIGNLGRDPETRYMPDGGAITNISIATTENWKDKAGEKQAKTE